jgi:hypothetical protein
MMQGQVIDLNDRLALEAAKIWVEKKLAIANSSGKLQKDRTIRGRSPT